MFLKVILIANDRVLMRLTSRDAKAAARDHGDLEAGGSEGGGEHEADLGDQS